MKSKLFVLFSALLVALAMMAQTATQTAPAPSGDSKACACCNHDKADGKMACCGQDGGCCKDGKCAMASHDGKDATAHEHMMSGDSKDNKCPMMSKDGKSSGCCCADSKCDMSKDSKGKSCCDGMKCQRKQTS